MLFFLTTKKNEPIKKTGGEKWGKSLVQKLIGTSDYELGGRGNVTKMISIHCLIDFSVYDMDLFVMVHFV